MHIFTIKDGVVHDGVIVEKFWLKKQNVMIPVIILGGELRNPRNIIPVKLTENQHKRWNKRGSVRIKFGDVSTTMRGRLKIISKKQASTYEQVLCVFKARNIFGCVNEYHGDLSDQSHLPFPGKVVASSYISNGNDWRTNFCEQIVAVLPKSVFCTSSNIIEPRYFMWNGFQLLGGWTHEQRTACSLF